LMWSVPTLPFVKAALKTIYRSKIKWMELVGSLE
jgi:hypothetical protein